MSFINAADSIACTLQLCQDNLIALYDVLENLPGNVEDASELPRCGDAIGRFSMWDAETGAGKGQLDYSLRNSSGLRDGVEELLRELATIIGEGGSYHFLLISLLILCSLVPCYNIKPRWPR